MSAKPANVGAAEPDLWSECWNQIIWGSQYDLDQAEAAAYKEARDHTAVSGKGVNRGKGRKHWSSALIHNDYYCPYPFTLEGVVVEQIAFCWDEYCQKTGKPEECVGDLGVATYQGKPPLPGGRHFRRCDYGAGSTFYHTLLPLQSPQLLQQCLTSSRRASQRVVVGPDGFSVDFLYEMLVTSQLHPRPCTVFSGGCPSSP